MLQKDRNSQLQTSLHHIVNYQRGPALLPMPFYLHFFATARQFCRPTDLMQSTLQLGNAVQSILTRSAYQCGNDRKKFDLPNLPNR